MLDKIIDINYHRKLVEIMIKGSFPGVYVAGIIMPFLMIYIVEPYADKQLLIIWALLNIVIFAIRLFSLKQLKLRLQNEQDLKPYISLSIFIVFITAVVHSLLLIYAYYFVPDLEFYFLSVVILSLVAGSLSTLVGIFHAYVIYTVVNSLTIIVLFTMHGGDIYEIFAFTTVIFMVVMIKNGQVHYESLKENILLQETFESRVFESTKKLKKQNEKLNSSLKNFQDLLDSSMIMTVFHTDSGEIVELNQEAISTFGYPSKEEAIGKNIREFIPEKSATIVAEALKHEYSSPYELLVINKRGEEFYVLISGKNTVLNSKKVRMVTMMDLTEIKNRDILLQKQAKLAQMGEMISMIAHQWRQPLAAISAASIGLNLKSQLGTVDKKTLEKITDDISSYAHHLSETIDDFRDFFKPNKNVESINFCDITEQVLSIVEKSIKNKNIEIRLELHCEEKFYSFSNELKQVVLNLIQNAQDALLEKDVENPYIEIVVKKSQNKELPYYLSVSDNAGGIQERVLEKIFDPYFSTKLEKNGSGLGLYMSKTIIEEHCNGKLNVENIDDGAKFSIELGSLKN
jgi:PAS domain S-box-containing protein